MEKFAYKTSRKLGKKVKVLFRENTVLEYINIPPELLPKFILMMKRIN